MSNRHHPALRNMMESHAAEWIAVMADTRLAQSAVDRLVSTSYELVVEGESYRRWQRPGRPPEPATSAHPTGASRLVTHVKMRA